MIVASKSILAPHSCSQKIVFQFLEKKSFVWKHFGKLFNSATGNQVDEGYNFCNVCFKHEQSEYRSQLLEDVRLKPRQQIRRFVLLFLYCPRENEFYRNYLCCTNLGTSFFDSGSGLLIVKFVVKSYFFCVQSKKQFCDIKSLHIFSACTSSKVAQALRIWQII